MTNDEQSNDEVKAYRNKAYNDSLRSLSFCSYFVNRQSIFDILLSYGVYHIGEV